MYWCKRPNLFLSALVTGFLFTSGLTSCRPDVKESGNAMKYFDLKGFFRADSARLNRMHPQVTKTVFHNDDQQTKQVTIGNWGEELALFSNSDINKPAWRQSYAVLTTPGFIIYTATDPELTTRRIAISRDSSTKKVKWILINNVTKNLLYSSAEKLTYYPDSLYIIEKKQSIRLIGINRYRIRGVIHH